MIVGFSHLFKTRSKEFKDLLAIWTSQCLWMKSTVWRSVKSPPERQKSVEGAMESLGQAEGPFAHFPVGAATHDGGQMLHFLPLHLTPPHPRLQSPPPSRATNRGPRAAPLPTGPISLPPPVPLHQLPNRPEHLTVESPPAKRPSLPAMNNYIERLMCWKMTRFASLAHRPLLGNSGLHSKKEYKNVLPAKYEGRELPSDLHFKQQNVHVLFSFYPCLSFLRRWMYRPLTAKYWWSGHASLHLVADVSILPLGVEWWLIVLNWESEKKCMVFKECRYPFGV